MRGTQAAAVLLTLWSGVAWATPVVDQENDPGGGTAIALGGNWGRVVPVPPFLEFFPGRELAQSITMDMAGRVSRVDLMLGWDAFLPFSTVTLTVVDGLPGAAGGFGTTVIDLTTVSATSTPSEFVAVGLAFPFEVTAGQTITLWLSGGGLLGDPVNGQSYWATGGSYSGGEAYTRCVDPNGSCGGNTSWVQAGTDFGFRVYVPEPGTVVLLSCGLVALGARRRHFSC